MKKIEFNNAATAKARQQQKPLTLLKEKFVVESINNLIENSRLPVDSMVVSDIQEFVNHYQNLSHHMTTTVGLHATDRPDLITDPKKVLFEIKF